MLLFFIICTIFAVVLAGIYTLKSMRSIDILAMVVNIMMKSGIISLLTKTGLNKRMRPKVAEAKASNGFKIIAPSPLFVLALEPVLKFKARDDDVYVTTYPKAGTTWAQEVVWLICNNVDLELARKSPLTCRSPFLESVDAGDAVKGIQSLETWASDKQRLIKTHLPYELLPEEVTSGRKGKIVWVARNPKDLCVSYYYFHVMNYGMPDPGTWDEFLSNFCSGNVGWGSWFPHTLKFWEEYQKDKERIFFTTYEAMKKDLRSEVAKIAQFLDKKLTDEQLDAITSHCTFDSMSKNESTNFSHMQKFGADFKKAKFMRKGQVGDWKNHFTLNQAAAFDAMYQEKIKGSGLDILFEI